MIRSILILSLFGIVTLAKADNDDLANILENAHMQTNPNAENPPRQVSGESVDNPEKALELYKQVRDTNQMNAERPAQNTPDVD